MGKVSDLSKEAGLLKANRLLLGIEVSQRAATICRIWFDGKKTISSAEAYSDNDYKKAGMGTKAQKVFNRRLGRVCFSDEFVSQIRTDKSKFVRRSPGEEYNPDCIF
ncbi:hypothetical protein CDAR_485681 [Caerostris darwini]|uniref:Uncharacterized protein n=1 Tax=Caerostris darwini TaxID=1538125 RepID=A0AAV4WJ20_9ARAC|nr:hypothetical protein CDAR_485681 [Caerostris darwini]